MRWTDKLHLWADEASSTGDGGRRNALNRAAFLVGRTLHWHDADEGEAWAVLTAAGRATGLPDPEIRATIRGALRDGAMRPFNDRRAPADPWAPQTPRRRPEAATARSKQTRQTGRSTDGLRRWSSALRTRDVLEVSAYLTGRGMNPERIDALGAARAFRGGSHPLIAPVYSPTGELVGVHRRAIDGRADKSKGSKGATGPRVIACDLGRRMLEGDASAVAAGLLVCEGETDLWTWASRLDPDHRPALIAIPGSGSWGRSIADRIPSATRVAVLTDRDEAGRDYRDQIGRALRGRCEVLCRPDRPFPGMTYLDETDLAAAGELDPDPWAGLVPLVVEDDGVGVIIASTLGQTAAREHMAKVLGNIGRSIHVGARYREAQRDPGCISHVVVAPTGAGKTHATGVMVRALWRRGGWSTWSRGEHDALHDARAGLLRLAKANGMPADELADLEVCAIKVPALREGCEQPERLTRYLAATGRQGDGCERCPLRATCDARRRVLAYAELSKRRGDVIEGIEPDYYEGEGEAAEALRAVYSEGHYRVLMRRTWIRFTTHDREALMPQWHVTDLHVVDECPAEAVTPTVEFTLADLVQARDAGAITCDDETWGRVATLVVGEPTTDPTVIAAALDGLRVGSTDELRQRMRERADRATAGEDDADERITAAHDLEALTLAEREGCRGSMAGRGALRLRIRRPFDEKLTRCRVYLDATAEPVVYRTFCEGARWHVVNAAPTIATEAVHFASPDRWAPHRDNLDGALTADRLRLWADDDGRTLYTMPLKLRDALDALGELAPAGYRAARADDRVTYYGAAEMRGTNRWSHCTRIRVVAHHVPRWAVSAEAHFLGDDAAAYRALNYAPVVQAIGRIARDAGMTVRRIEIMGAAHCTYGLHAERVDVDLEAMRAGAAPRGLDCWATLVRERVEAMPLATLYRLGDVLEPSVPPHTLPPRDHIWGLGCGVGQARKLVDNLAAEERKHGIDPAGIDRLWHAAGLGTLPVRWDGRREVLGFNTDDVPTAAEVERWARSLPDEAKPRTLSWLDPDSGQTIAIELWEAQIGPALRRLARRGEQPTVRAIAAECARIDATLSRAAVGRLTKGRNDEVRDLWERYVAEHAAEVSATDAPTPGEVETFAERAAIAEYDGGADRVMAERLAAERTTGAASDRHRLAAAERRATSSTSTTAPEPFTPVRRPWALPTIRTMMLERDAERWRPPPDVSAELARWLWEGAASAGAA